MIEVIVKFSNGRGDIICSSFSGAQNFAHNEKGMIIYDEIFNFFKKDAIASFLKISRPTFDKKIHQNCFNHDECRVMDELFFFLYRLKRSN